MTYQSRRHWRRRSRIARITGLAGEVLLTAGAVMGLFMAWHLVWNDAIQGEKQEQSATSFAEQWRDNSWAESGTPAESAAGPSNIDPPVTSGITEASPFALLYVPRFGADYVRTIAEGVDPAKVLNSRTLGVGRYPESNNLGEIGNFALAGHRNAWGGSFSRINELRIGDRIYVEVPEGWHSYLFRNFEFVWETDVKVLNSFPKMSIDPEDTRVITLTSCHPRFTVAERIIAYGVYEGWYPREDGIPAEIFELVTGTSN
jgi:sortase A